jgi:hypothetical protein
MEMGKDDVLQRDLEKISTTRELSFGHLSLFSLLSHMLVLLLNYINIRLK